MLFSAVNTQFSAIPRNTVETVGSTTHFRCGGEKLGWDKYLSGEENPLSISVYENVTNTNKYQLEVYRSETYRLLISETTLQDAGRYRCKYVPLPTLYRDAELVVLGEETMLPNIRKKSVNIQ